MRRPVDAPYTITTEFGVPDSYAKFQRHSGVDYAVPLNRPVFAPISGQLQNIVSPTGGNMVVIFDGTYWHRLMHNNSFSRANGWVDEGLEVAKAGTTGLSTGVHCHWDVNGEGVYPTTFRSFISPADWLAGKYQTNTGVQVMNQEAGTELYRTALFREPESTAGASQWNGQSPAQALRAVRGAEWQSIKGRLQAYDALQAKVAELSARPTKAELEAVVQTANSERDKVAVLEQALAEEKAKPPIQIPVEVIKEVEVNPSWLRKAIDFINNLLRSK